MVKLAKKVKQKSERRAVAEARERLETVFAEIPFVRLKGSETDARISGAQVDLLLNALVSGRPVQFIVGVKAVGEPRLVRVAVEQLKKYLQGSKDAYGIIVAPYLSDAGRQICRDAGIGCADLAGNAYLSFQSIYIDKSGVPNPFLSTRAAKSVFSPKSSRILRVLLAKPSRKWYVEEISKEAGISIGLASRIKQALLAEEWIREENKRFSLVNPEDVLKQWSENHTYTKSQAFSFYSSLSEEELEEAVNRECNKRKLRYGLALFSGARKVAPFVRFPRFFAYVDGNIDAIAKTLEFKKVETGANVTLLVPYDDKGVFYGLRKIGGVDVVSDIQLYLDLKSYGGRGEEAAEAVFEQGIKSAW